ncbi:MAG: hypothetical protein C0171_06085 [Caldisphaera sp.]|nr:MAG: hypothetical protein C0171_06085 [Caldisphaera sp.]
MYNTLLNKVDRTVISKFVQIKDSLYENDKINVWGLVPGPQNERQWSRFRPGDIVIFVPSKYNLIVTKILAKERNRDLANTLWGEDKNGKTWELIFFVKILNIIKKDKRSFLRELGYSEGDQLIGNRKITDKFFSKYSSIDNFIDQHLEDSISPEYLSDEIATQVVQNVLGRKSNRRKKYLERLKEEALKQNSRDYIEVKGKRIKRKAIFVAYVKERDGYKCRVCNFTFKKKDGENYVEVAHIIPLSEGGLDHPDNMVCLCPNCHKKLDLGDDDVRKEIIDVLKSKGLNPWLQDR